MKNKYDVAKLFTLLLVVFAYSSKMLTDQAAIDNFGINETLSYITSFIYSFHMPVFIAISGSVFSICMKSGKYSNIVKFVNNKARRLLIPYLFFSIFIVLPVLCFCNLVEGNLFHYYIRNYIFCLNNRHLWYIIVCSHFF